MQTSVYEEHVHTHVRTQVHSRQYIHVHMYAYTHVFAQAFMCPHIGMTHDYHPTVVVYSYRQRRGEAVLGCRDQQLADAKIKKEVGGYHSKIFVAYCQGYL